MPDIRVRNLRVGEKLPTFIDETGFERLSLLPEWVWVAEYQGRVCAAVFACNGHGMLILLRIVSTIYAPNAALIPLLRQTFRDAKSRGLIGFFAQFQEGRYSEERLLGACVRAGAYFMPKNVINAFGSFKAMNHVWPNVRKPRKGK